MRIAVVTDIHGSLRALEAVTADMSQHTAPDLIVQAGDIALFGPRPSEVIDLVRALGWPSVLGNTEEELWDPLPAVMARLPSPTRERLMGRLARWLDTMFTVLAPATKERIGEERIRWLRSLPSEWRQGDVWVLHAAPGDLWSAPQPDASDAVLAQTYGTPTTRFAVYGHIHRPFARTVTPGLTVANAGSVGMCYDGDPRASYVVIDTEGSATVRRVEYDVEAECADLRTSGYPMADWLGEVRRQATFLPLPAPARNSAPPPH